MTVRKKHLSIIVDKPRFKPDLLGLIKKFKIHFQKISLEKKIQPRANHHFLFSTKKYTKYFKINL